jgi:drug/metabolite transporter (DMT)-like permease
MSTKLLFISLSVFLGVIGQLAFKQGMLKIGQISKNIFDLIPYYFKAIVNPYIWLGIISYGISFLIWLGVLSRVELSYARPLVASGYILVAVFSWWFWGENLGWQRWIGIALIAVGVVLVSKS